MRLKGERAEIHRRQSQVSIPFDAIKRLCRNSPCSNEKVSIPFDAIKRRYSGDISFNFLSFNSI